jgi:hypothetical protein
MRGKGMREQGIREQGMREQKMRETRGTSRAGRRHWVGCWRWGWGWGRHLGSGAGAIVAAGTVLTVFGIGGPAASASGAPGRMSGTPGRMSGTPGRMSGTPGRVVPSAHAARTLDGTDTAHLHLLHQRETVVFEEGAASGALPGHMRAQLEVGSVFTGTCTIYTGGGTITGHGRATPHGSGRYQSFSGTLTITGGSGRYAHAHGQTGLYGTFDRRTFALVIQTSGRIAY